MNRRSVTDCPVPGRPGPVLLLILILLTAGIVLLLAAAHARPNASAVPQALTGKSASVAGTILDSWDEESTGSAESSASGLVPRARFHREVCLRSDADIDTWGYVLLKLPKVRAAFADGPYGMYEALLPHINETDFVLVGESKKGAGLLSLFGLSGDPDSDDSTLRLYRFRRPLQPGETTPPLFTEVGVPDFSAAEALNGELAALGYLIQREHLDESRADSLARRWAGL